jgi:hypothetical protein
MMSTLRILDRMRKFKGYPKQPMYTYTKLPPHTYSASLQGLVEVGPVYIKRFCEYVDLDKEATEQILAYHKREKLSSYLRRTLKIPETAGDICALLIIYQSELTTEQYSKIANTIFKEVLPFISGLPPMFTIAMEDVKNDKIRHN